MRHSTQGRSPFLVRLACVKHAASVQSEPESNSPVQICPRSLLSQKSESQSLSFPLAIHLSMNLRASRSSRRCIMLLFAALVNAFFQTFNFFSQAEIQHCPQARKGLMHHSCALVNFFFALLIKSYCCTKSLVPTRKLFSSTPFQRFRSSTLTLYARAMRHRLSWA